MIYRILFLAGSMPQMTQKICLYSDKNFKGALLRLDASKTNLHQRSFGDKISSLYVPENYEVILFEHSNFKGKSLSFSGPVEIIDLTQFHFNDKISSVSIYYEGKRYGESYCKCSRCDNGWRHIGGGENSDTVPCNVCNGDGNNCN